ncbi:hypothetical protein PRIPAC_71317 [Pristionchus pacificus]|uniref:UDP-glucuronosyltransferase n=1 Tax=Pristionchus pacificus TaxID=54126 RepID=A0A2A6BFK8_PRIPA|nr:hypothetical protein PRIPAC_71317 [Pristionchus pacificus]|eukprot:PDM64670.1 glucuronosyltransferase [Pristionchus pacificus]
MKALLLLLSFISLCQSAKVAIFLASLSKSQVVFNLRLAEEIAVDHDVILIRPSFNPDADQLVSNHPRVRELRPKGCEPDSFHLFYEAENAWVWSDPSFSETANITGLYRKMFYETCKNMAENEEFLNEMRKEKFDLALHHHLDSCTLGVVNVLQIPQWGWVLSTPLFRSMINLVGVPVLPSYFPALLTDASNEMDFIKRLKNFVWEMFCDLYMPLGSKPYTQIFRNRYGDDFPSMIELAREGRFLMANVHPDIEFPVPVTNKVVYIGGLGLKKETNPLQEPFASFVNKSKKTVLVSFGSVADTNKMPVQWKEAFIGLFKANPNINFIWKFDQEIDVPSNVLRKNWLPQNDLLGSDKVVAFITHGGYNSVGESISTATPIVAIPLFGDQFRNARMAEYRKFGARLYKRDITTDNLNKALHKVINDPSYLLSAREVQSIALSSIVHPGHSIRHTINFTLSHPHYNRDLPQLGLISLYSLDVIAFLFLLPSILLYLILRKIAGWYYWSCCDLAYKEKAE